jgi:hypothetical protein
MPVPTYAVNLAFSFLPSVVGFNARFTEQHDERDGRESNDRCPHGLFLLVAHVISLIASCRRGVSESLQSLFAKTVVCVRFPRFVFEIHQFSFIYNHVNDFFWSFAVFFEQQQLVVLKGVILF